VLSLAEAPRHPHNMARATFLERGGVVEPAPAPRFSSTPARAGHPPHSTGADSEAVLADWGFATGEIERLRGEGVVGSA
jgi:alpha-methylacyl-CoA racemase